MYHEYDTRSGDVFCVHKHLKILHRCALENTTPYPQIHPCFKYYLIEIQELSLGWRIILFKRHFSKRVYVKWDLIFGNLVETLDARRKARERVVG